jgi:negative regulator of flagellin synthesis FlgM
MDIRNSLDGLKSILGVAQPAAASAQPKSGATKTGGGGLGSDQAIFSSAASAVSQGSNDSGVRMDKVASIQAALAAGTYNVSPAALASKMVDSMLGASQ